MTRLEGRNCLITGAGSGIGAAIAARLVEEGANVTLTDIDLEAAEAWAGELGSTATAVAADVTSEKQMRAAAEHVVQRFGSLDVIYNNAGITKFTPLPALERDDFDSLMAVNVYGVLVGCKVAAEQMVAQGNGGKIVNTCSVVGKRGAPHHVIYTATKFAIRGITQSLAQELANERITVNAFCPGIVDTPLWGPVSDAVAAAGLIEQPEDLPRMLAENAILGRGSVPEDVVGIAAFLGASDSDYITGQCVNVDGGMVFD